MSSADMVRAPFHLDSIEEAAAPEGCNGTWQRYVITQGINTIVGMRCGARSEVAVTLESFVERLNMRFAKQPGKVGR